MYNAPSVSYPVGHCAFQRRLWLMLLSISALVCLAWARHQPLTWVWGASLWVVLVAAVVGWRSLHAGGTLQWDGTSWLMWRYSPEGGAQVQGGEVRKVLDTQQVLLLQWLPSPEMPDAKTAKPRWGVPRRAQWLWLAQDNAPLAWHDLRRALYAQLPKL